MKVEKVWFSNLSPQEINKIKSGADVVIVVDLWASTTNLVLMLGEKPRRVIVINDDEYGRARKIYPSAVLIGQSYKIPGKEFVSGNSAFEIDSVDILGKDILYLSFNGTKVLEAFSNSKKGRVFVGSITDYIALAEKIMEMDAAKVTIIASGNLTNEYGGVVFIEDWMGAEAIEKRLMGQKFDFGEFKDKVKRAMISYVSSYDPYGLDEADERVWPYIFGPGTDIVPTAFVNSDGFVEVVQYGSG